MVRSSGIRQGRAGCACGAVAPTAGTTVGTGASAADARRACARPFRCTPEQSHQPPCAGRTCKPPAAIKRRSYPHRSGRRGTGSTGRWGNLRRACLTEVARGRQGRRAHGGTRRYRTHAGRSRQRGQAGEGHRPATGRATPGTSSRATGARRSRLRLRACPWLPRPGPSPPPPARPSAQTRPAPWPPADPGWSGHEPL